MRQFGIVFVLVIVSVSSGSALASAQESGRVPADTAHADVYQAALRDYEAGRFAPALAAFTNLATQRVVEAQFMLGVMAEFGDGVPTSYHEAVAWYRTAAEAGLASAQYRLGTLYANGIGVAPDRAQAETWLRKAAGQGDTAALLELGEMRSAGRGNGDSREDAYAYYWLAANAGVDAAGLKVRELEQALTPAELVAARNHASTLRSELTAKAVPGGTATGSQAAAAGTTLGLRRESIRDPKMKADAGTLLVPENWVVEGGIAWDRHLAHLAAPWVVVSDPQSFGAAEIFPPRAFIWEDGGIEFAPIGTIRRGYEVRPPISDAALFVESVVLVRERRDSENLRVLESESLPEVAAALVATARRFGARTAADAARLRVAYERDGVEFEEDFYCVLGRVDGNTIGKSEVWGPKLLISLRARAGERDSSTGLLMSVATSHRIDRKWHDKYRQVLQMWNQGRGNSTPRENTLDMYVGAVTASQSPTARQAYEVVETLEWKVLAALAERAAGTRVENDPAGEGQLAVPATSTSLVYGSDGVYRLAYQSIAPPPAVVPKSRGAQFDTLLAGE